MNEKMHKIDKIWKVRIPLSSGKDSRGFKFVGAIEVITDELNIIYDWKLTANKINIDRMCNRQWFNKKPLAFKYREDLFQHARIDRQFDRPLHHTIKQEFISQAVKLNVTGIDTVLEWVNDEDTFKRHHIMHLPEIFSGESRSTAEAYAKEELLYTSFEGKQIPFSILLKDHVVNRDEFGIKDINEIIGDALLVDEIDFEKWVSMNPESIGKWTNMLCNVDIHTKAVKDVEQKIEKEAIKHFKKATKAHAICIKELEKFNELVTETYGHANQFFHVEVVEEDPFGESFLVQEKFINTHIYPIWKIKKDIVEAKTKVDQDAAVAMIADIENYLPLGEFVKQLFERGDVYYDDSGYMKVLFKSIGRAKAAYGYHQIPKKFLTDLNKWYLAKHRELHQVDPFVVIAEEKAAEDELLG